MDGWVLLRPWWLWAYLPILLVGIYWWFRPQSTTDWQKHCDAKLLAYLKYAHGNNKWFSTWLLLMLSMSLMVFSLAGPSWKKIPMPVGQIQKPVMLVMDLSTNMLLDDITPSRLERAKFLIEDSLKANPELQWGLMVFSQQVFLVSPFTNDIQNILNFLPVLTPKLLPVGGYDVNLALNEADKYSHSTGMINGKILVISSKFPNPSTLDLLGTMSKQGHSIAWVNDSSIFPSSSFPKGVEVFDIKSPNEKINAWLNQGFSIHAKQLQTNSKLLQWQDQGRGFLGLALLALMMVFRKGWFLRLWV
jgi:Ca-activated chloride channel family protein